MSPRKWLATWWERLIGVITGVMALASVILIALTLLTGQDTNRLAQGQSANIARSECVGSYAAADRVAAANLQIRADQVDGVFGEAILSPDPESYRDTYEAAIVLRDDAIVERAEVAAVQDDANDDCRPDGNGQVSGTPPVVEPVPVP